MSDDNRRNYFRVELFDVAIKVIIEGETYNGMIKDISGNGISFFIKGEYECEECTVQFLLGSDSYQYQAKVIRISEHGYGQTLYACELIGLTPSERSKISAYLLRIDAQRRNWIMK